ncbi:MAG: dihydropteroate synthase [Bacteroidota bacterium]
MKAKDTFFYPKTTLNCKGKLLDASSPLVMGILNLTPDSFFDGGSSTTIVEILKKTEQMLTQGAAIIDVGAVSTKPGAAEVSLEEERQRILPIFKLLVKEFPQAIFSVDTFRSQIAYETVQEGAHIINDVSAGELDTKMLKVVGKLNVPYILMHMQGTPQNMQQNPVYQNVVTDVYKYFHAKIEQAKSAGIKDIILDPGFGFGKTVEHNYQLLKELRYFLTLHCMVLTGVSRKAMINKVLNCSAKDALNGTTAVNTIALLNGAQLLRVHDVKEAVEAVKIVKQYFEV